VKIKQALATIELVKVPGGSIEMPVVGEDGQIDPTRKQMVAIKPFWLGKTELPWDFFDIWSLERDLCPEEQKLRIAEEAGDKTAHSWSRPSKIYNDATYGFGREGYAAISIHPRGAAAFCRWMSIVTGSRYRLATEAEWEYACRANSTVPTSPGELEKIAWYIDNSENMDNAQFSAQRLASKPANAFGLHDMLGNVSEWVMGNDGQYVLKGGNFESMAEELTPGHRIPMNPGFQLRDPQHPKSIWWLSDGKIAGFRIVREED
jgi:formylglycine-generating enzyme required for sulfatase activity